MREHKTPPPPKNLPVIPKRPKQMSSVQKRLLAVIATLFAQIQHYETVESINKVRAQIRKYVKSWYYHEYDDYVTEVMAANDAWEKISKQVAKEGFPPVSMSESLYALTPFLDFKQQPFTEKSLHKAARAVDALSGNSYNRDEASRSAFRLMELIAADFGLKYESPVKKIVAQERARKALKEKEEIWKI